MEEQAKAPGMLMSCSPPSRSPLCTFAAFQARLPLLAPIRSNKINFTAHQNSVHCCSVDNSDGGHLEDTLGVVIYLRDDLDQAAQYFPPTPADGIHDTFGVISHLVQEMHSTGAYYPSPTRTQKEVVEPREFVTTGQASAPNHVTARGVQPDFQPYPYSLNQVHLSHKQTFYTQSALGSSTTTSSASGFSIMSSNRLTYSPLTAYSPAPTSSGPNAHFSTRPTTFAPFVPEKPQTTVTTHQYPNWYDIPGARKDFSFNGPPPSAEVKAEMMQVAPHELEPTCEQVRLWIYAQEANEPVTTETVTTTGPAASTLRPEQSGRYHFSLQAVRHSLGHAIAGLLKFAVEAVVGKAGNRAWLDAGQAPWCYEREMEEIPEHMGERLRGCYDSGISSSSTEYWSGRSSNTCVTATDNWNQNWTTQRASDEELDDTDESDGGVGVDW